MKPFISIITLSVFVMAGLAGCADKLVSDLAPNDNAVVQEQAPLAKNYTIPFTLTHFPVAPIDPGTVSYPGQGVMSIGHQVTVLERWNASSPLVDGYSVNAFSWASHQETGEAELHGNISLTPSAPDAGGGVWEGTWSGKQHFTGTAGAPEYKAYLEVRAHGAGGAIHGMRLTCNTVVTYWETPPPFWMGQAECELGMNVTD